MFCCHLKLNCYAESQPELKEKLLRRPRRVLRAACTFAASLRSFRRPPGRVSFGPGTDCGLSLSTTDGPGSPKMVLRMDLRQANA
jgi:hypothetical protein